MQNPGYWRERAEETRVKADKRADQSRQLCEFHVYLLSLTLANFDWVHPGRETLKIGSFSTIS